jgi:anti-sigma factor RsiW
MSECRSIDPLVTPYVDGQLSEVSRAVVDRHLLACAACRSRIRAEQSALDLLLAHRAALRGAEAPVALLQRCRAMAEQIDDPAVPAWRPRAFRLALAASVLAVVGGVSLYWLTQVSTRVMAAELAVDHMKCFVMNAVFGTSHAHADVERSLASTFSWEASLPSDPEQAGLQLVGARPCLYGEGMMAHIMYSYEGRPVSVFMLPDNRRPDELIEVMGHQAAVWTSGDRTFVLVARESPAEVQRLASFIHATLR